MGESKIIVVANQKGGVGKSSICMSLANYLTRELKFRVGGIIDTDPQLSVFRRRISDKERTKGTPDTPAYEVSSFDLSNYAKIPDLAQDLRKTGMIYIFDTPGLLKHQGIVALLAIADVIIIPFNFDTLTLASTIQFLVLWNNLKSSMKQDQSIVLETKLFFIPVMIDNRIGTATEVELWQDVRKHYSQMGVITPPIGYYADMKRCNTIMLNQKQLKVVQDAYQTLVDNIYNPELQTDKMSDNDGENYNTES
ncbi:ParA family protein [Bacteroides caecimuris]|jgi:chromosome partitioning protein|uniref:ParA family protein n=1 Tax=Bacteroides caecimuris TaxID=1796613 RepID=UPI00256FBE93|nr:ParA family protein [Bacteroides caecimuris]